MAGCRVRPRADPVSPVSVTPRSTLSTVTYLKACPPLVKGRDIADVRRIPCQGPFSGSPVRTETTTSWIARVTAAA
jgi:hypothetical protein